MKKRNIIMIATTILTFGMIGTSVACAGSEQNETKQENTAEKDTTDNKKENVKTQDEVILNTAKMVTVEVATNSDVNEVVPEESNSENVEESNASIEDATAGNVTTSTGNRTGNSSSSGNTNSGRNSNTSSNNTTASTPVHTHSWVHVDATGHYETVTVQAAWDEEVPVYGNVAHDICNVCGADLTNLTEENASAHSRAHALAYEGSGWHTEWKYEQTGTQIVHHDAVTEQKWVQDNPAYDKCSTCGATK